MLLSVAAAVFVLGMLQPFGAPPAALADGCLYGDWQMVSYRDAIQAVLGPSYAVEDVNADSRVSLHADHTFDLTSNGRIAATKDSHHITLSFSGAEAGNFSEEVPGQFVVTAAVVNANASDITIDGTHLPGPVDLSSLFMWTPPSIVGASASAPGQFAAASAADSATTLEFTYTCDPNQLALQQFHARVDAPPVTYQRASSGPDVAASNSPFGSPDSEP
ncbi:MAG: hypothetical protein JOZ65_33015 [Chloroflexi bacterium]|nr:hypothetical protein [Chloroflexota bacterium]